MSSPYSNLVQLPLTSYCGKYFGHRRWIRHLGRCEVCLPAWETFKNSEKEKALKAWSTLCGCGCGKISAFNKQFYGNHRIITDAFREKKRHDCLKNPMMSSDAAKAKISKFWTGRKRPNQTGDLNIAKTDRVRSLLSEKNAMHNPEHRVTQKAGCLTDLEKQRRSDNLKRNNPAHKKESLEKRIDTYSRKLAAGLYTIKNAWKTGWFLKKDGTQEWFDSSLEEKRMRVYEEEGVIWTKKHGIRIPYISNKGLHTYYIPDFLVVRNGITYIEETKGWMTDGVRVKAQVAIDYCTEHNMKYVLLLGSALLPIAELSSPEGV